MSFDANEVHAAVYQIFTDAKLTVPSFRTSTIIDALFPEIDVTGEAIEAFAKIQVWDEPLPSGKRATITYDEKSLHPTHRFSIAHELAHWLFDFRRGTLRPTVLCGRRGGKAIIERRADYFAAELLVPLWILDGDCDFSLDMSDDIDERSEIKNKTQLLASKYNVSLRCMQMRLKDLHYWRQMRRGR